MRESTSGKVTKKAMDDLNKSKLMGSEEKSIEE